MEIRGYLLKESAIETEKQKGSAKGFEFEEKVCNDLQTLASHYENVIEMTGEKTGTKDKKGDISIELENKKKIIVECKDSSSYSAKKTITEINDAIDNRKASFGIFVFAKREEMPKEICPIKITDKYIVTYYDEDNLYFAYRIARLLLLRKGGEVGGEINFEKISAELNSIEDNFKELDYMQTKASSIINSGEYIRSHLKAVREKIDENLQKIKRSLGEKYEDEAALQIE